MVILLILVSCNSSKIFQRVACLVITMNKNWTNNPVSFQTLIFCILRSIMIHIYSFCTCFLVILVSFSSFSIFFVKSVKHCSEYKYILQKSAKLQVVRKSVSIRIAFATSMSNLTFFVEIYLKIYPDVSFFVKLFFL